MRETSDLYKRLWADPAHINETRLIIAGEIYDESKIELSTLTTTEPLFAEDKLAIGGAVARDISFSAFLSDSVPKRAKIIHEVRLRVGDEVSEWLQKGEYYISTRRRDRITGLTAVHGYDSMLTAEQEWKPADTDIFPMPMKEAVEKTAAILGITLDPRNVFKTGDAYKVDYPVADGTASEDQQVKGLTIRQVWRWIAGAMGGNFIINDLGQLRLVPLTDVTATGYLSDKNGTAITSGENAILVRTAAAAADSEELSALGLNSAEVSDTLPLDPITRVILKISSDTGYVSESDTEGLTLEVSCAYGSQTMADDLLAQLQGYVYQPLQAEDALIDPAAELGDPIELNGVYTILAQKDTLWDALAAADIGAPGGGELEDEYGFTSAEEAEIWYQLAATRSLISKTAKQIRLELQAADGRYTELQLDMNGLSSEVQGLEGEYAALALTVEGFTVTDGNGTTRIRGSSVDTTTLNVQNINFTGVIRYDDFDEDTQSYFDEIYDLAAEAYDLADSVQLPSYIKSTYIGKTEIRSPDIYAGKFYATGQGRSSEAAYYIYDSWDEDDGLGNEVGYLSYDTSGAGSTEEAANRVMLTTIANTALKLNSAAGLSLEAASRIYMMSEVMFSDGILLANGYGYGSALPSSGTSGQLFFLRA